MRSLLKYHRHSRAPEKSAKRFAFCVISAPRLGWSGAVLFAFSFILGCGGGHASSAPAASVTSSPELTASDVQAVVQAAAVSVNVPAVVAVTSRGGEILAVFQQNGAPATSTGNFGATVDTRELAVAVARTDAATAEFAAFSGAVGAGLGAKPAAPGVVVIDGIGLPFVNQTSIPPGVSTGVMNGSFLVGPVASPGPVPEGDLIAQSAGTIGGLTSADVQQVVSQAIANANQTRAVIRLPDGQRAKFAIAVVDLDGRLLALNRMHDSTVFSIDVAVGKARNMVYFSSAQLDPNDLPGVPPGTAVTNRTISFGAQPFFPPGINLSSAGPFFSLYQFDTANPCTNGHQPANPNQNGVVFFPGSVPLYKNGVLVGGLGISGDGVEQDDYVSAGASVGFEAPTAIRADQLLIRGVRLPYLKFPRNPTL